MLRGTKSPENEDASLDVHFITRVKEMRKDYPHVVTFLDLRTMFDAYKYCGEEFGLDAISIKENAIRIHQDARWMMVFSKFAFKDARDAMLIKMKFGGR